MDEKFVIEQRPSYHPGKTKMWERHVRAGDHPSCSQNVQEKRVRPMRAVTDRLAVPLVPSSRLADDRRSSVPKLFFCSHEAAMRKESIELVTGTIRRSSTIRFSWGHSARIVVSD